MSRHSTFEDDRFPPATLDTERLEDVLIEITQDSDARLPRTTRQGNVQIETAQSTIRMHHDTDPTTM